MSLDTDLLLDRRRLKRRLFLWRGVAVLAVVAVLMLALGRDPEALLAREHVARLTVSGTITDDRRIVEAVDAVAKDENARALLVVIDSPGGTVAGGESLHGALARVAETKPVVAVMGGTAASAGYMIAMPAARVFARESTLTGSIGVKLMLPEFSGLMEKLGVGDNTIASGPLKDEPSLTHKLTGPGRVVMQGIVADMHDQFVAMVAAGRAMDAARVRELADGRPYTGRQALALGLVDAIGGEREARLWLAEAKQVDSLLPVRDVGKRGLAERALGESISGLLRVLAKTVLSQQLDAAWAIWQPGGAGE
ncbi:MAG: signal peptide peptidase SppA [Acetobacteraceae bacterium]|nr:signal peptide peptidase SppA [Acetobacteraceae bacterium]